LEGKTAVGIDSINQALIVKDKQQRDGHVAIVQRSLDLRLVDRLPDNALAGQQGRGIPGTLGQVAHQFSLSRYLDKSIFRQALDIPTEQEVWLYLFHQKGAATWRMAGPFMPEKGDALAAAVNNYFTNL
jgi:hypothetical protein